jgi:hypothetical protein
MQEEFYTFAKTNNKSTGEAQPANYLKSARSRITDYTTQCQLVNAKQETTEIRNVLQFKSTTYYNAQS